MPSPAENMASIQATAIALSAQNGQYLTKAHMLNYFPFPWRGHAIAEGTSTGQYVKTFITQLPESSFCVHSLSTGTVVNLCYEVVPDYTQSPGGLTMDNVPGCTSLIDNTTIGCRAAFSITCNGALKVSEAAYYIHSGVLGDECVIAGRRDMGVSSASGIVKEMGTSNEVTHTVLNRNMAIEQFTEQAALSGLVREDFVALIKREGIEFNGGNYTMENSPETFAWFLKTIDKIKDWPEPKQASIVVPAPGDSNASQTDEPTTSPEQETSSVQGTGVSQQPTETISTATTQAPSTSEQGEPLEPAVENASNITNSEPKITGEPQATEPEQDTHELRPTDVVTEEPQDSKSIETPAQELPVTTEPRGTESVVSTDPEGTEEPKDTKIKTSGDHTATLQPTPAPEEPSPTRTEEDNPSDQSDVHGGEIAQHPNPAHSWTVQVPLIVGTVAIGGMILCLFPSTKKLCVGLFNRLSAGEMKHDTYDNNAVSICVSPTPAHTPKQTPLDPEGVLNDLDQFSFYTRNVLVVKPLGTGFDSDHFSEVDLNK
jgi:hypothetical protein